MQVKVAKTGRLNHLYVFISDPDWSDEEPTVAKSSRSGGGTGTAKAFYNLREGPKKTYIDEPTGVTYQPRQLARLSTFSVGFNLKCKPVFSDNFSENGIYKEKIVAFDGGS